MKPKAKTVFLASTVTLFALSLICYPQQSLEASIRGLNMWWEVVFPSLLPFFIVSELLISFGVVNLLGVLLEPLMRPLFRVPGVGGFVWAMGMASGYPSGAKLTARLYQEKQISTIEAFVFFSLCIPCTSRNPAKKRATAWKIAGRRCSVFCTNIVDDRWVYYSLFRH